MYCSGTKVPKAPVAMRLGGTPVPIPNTTVKTQAADGTMLETAWESRWLPDTLNEIGAKAPFQSRIERSGDIYLSHLENCIQREKTSKILKK